ncbi:MAG: phospholipase [Marmoricola sp.]|nr:phospholipase [Marmoricola sp.]
MALFEGMSRRDVMKILAGAGGAATLNSLAGPVIERAYAADPCGSGSLDDIEHFVFLMQENRSFDHYYGTMSGVRGFGDTHAISNGLFEQKGYNVATKKADPNSFVMPFRLDTTQGATLDGEAINDPAHGWGPQHQSWNNGAMDQWVKVHVANDGVANGPATMGYYKREDIPVHFALADAFTICDHYFCSVLGPTDPNRLYWISGTIDPDGTHGGPLLETPTLVPQNKYSWETYPERLQEAGVSWKVYTSQQAPIVSGAVLSGMLGAFKKFQNPLSPLYQKGIAPLYPQNFSSDVKNNKLPKVSWIIPDLLACEHPALPPSFGAAGILKVLDILTSNPAVWEKTALIISYDENGGFFDHVAPPTPPPGTPGEYVTVSPLSKVKSSAGIAGPIGLGFRVPGLVISPFSRGGLVASEVFDHTSQLRLVEERYGVPVPNLTAWRRETVGDMTSTFNFAATKDASKPDIQPRQEKSLGETLTQTRLGLDVIAGTFFASQAFRPYPVPPNSMPPVESTPARPIPSGPIGSCTTAGHSSALNSVPGLTEITPDSSPKRIAAAGEEIRAHGKAQAQGGQSDS